MMSDTTQVHEIFFMAEDQNKKMVMLEDYLESLADIHKLKQRITEHETQVRSIALSRDELAVTVERLKKEQPEVAAKAVEEYYYMGWEHSLSTKSEDGDHYSCGRRLAKEFADAIRQTAKADTNG